MSWSRSCDKTKTKTLNSKTEAKTKTSTFETKTKAKTVKIGLEAASRQDTVLRRHIIAKIYLLAFWRGATGYTR